jgi:hypothetical protein
MGFHVNRPKLHEYLTRYWKIWAGVALAALAAGNTAFGWVSPETAGAIGMIAGGLGIAMHHKGDALPPPPTGIVQEVQEDSDQ